MTDDPGGGVIARAHQQTAAQLRAFALSLPGAYEEFPWGERVVKVNKKVFVFLGKDDPGSELGLSVKLPQSAEGVLMHPFTEPTGYGLGRAGWITARFTPRTTILR